ncbi:ribosome assembly factor SBDS [Candidatus Woesearchaeota archaeon]|nr:ribosome assembly factor SBDS [Candidatus Woesearchaeota archaeon]
MTDHLAKLKKGSESFEIVINPEEAMAFRQGKGELGQALVFEKIFSDAKKGLEASESRLEAVFNTSDPLEVATQILQHGDIQVSSEYRQKIRDQKRKQIINWIHRHSIDPRQNTPHPVTRIEAALEEAKVRIDENKDAESQVEKIVDQLKVVLAIRITKKSLAVTLPAAHAAKCFQLVRQYGKVLKEAWDENGNWTGTVEIPGGLEPEFYEKVNAATHGQNNIEVIQ